MDLVSMIVAPDGNDFISQPRSVVNDNHWVVGSHTIGQISDHCDGCMPGIWIQASGCSALQRRAWQMRYRADPMARTCAVAPSN
jgi:hypothetical protein